MVIKAYTNKIELKLTHLLHERHSLEHALEGKSLLGGAHGYKPGALGLELLL